MLAKLVPAMPLLIPAASKSWADWLSTEMVGASLLPVIAKEIPSESAVS